MDRRALRGSAITEASTEGAMANTHFHRLRTSRYNCGFSLLELALSLSVLGILLSALLPLQAALHSRYALMRETAQLDIWLHQIEGFALIHHRLPCPAPDNEGQEMFAGMAGPCQQSNGWLPWRSMGLPRPAQSPLYAVASLETLGTPYAHTLTRRDGLRQIPVDTLSAALFAPPDTSGPSPGTLPALLVKNEPIAASGSTSDAATLASLPGMPCAGTQFLTVSAVALISMHREQQAEFTGTNRCYNPPPVSHAGRMRWLSYERLVWLYTQSGLMTAP